MQAGYKLLITDLDGTLLDVRGGVHERDRRAIAALLERGVGVSLCTGRMYSGSREIARELNLTCPIGCVDGSHIVHPRHDDELVLKSMDCDAARELCLALNEHRPVTFVFADDTLHHDENGAEFLSYVSTWSRCTRLLDDVIAEPRWSQEGCISGLVAIGHESQILGVERFVRERLADRLQVAAFEIRRMAVASGTWGMVVRAAGAS
jgi:hydroxymethylpyrimidine pyrophosphatase-like HAD family hydrolase